jgi:surface carbohydrate biosynthesis protein
LQPIAYLTCELKGRDLDSRALIAAHLVKRGYTVVFGQYWSLKANTPVVPHGYYLFKTSNQIQVQGMTACKMYGHAVIASDEEVLSAAEAYAYETTAPATFDLCDLYLAVSDAHQRGIHKAFPESVGRVRVVGSARFDLLRAARYPRPHAAPYVLVNTSFGLRNTIYGDAEKAVRMYFKALLQDINNPDHRAVMQARLDWEKASMEETRKLIWWLIERGGVDVVIRPHPNENAGWWHKHFGNRKRIHIVERSDPFPWMQHAALMIHSDSTTGLEAVLMGTPVINISPVDAWADRCSLRAVNYSVRSAQDATAPIASLLDRGEGPIAEARSLDIFPRDCADAIAQAMASIMPPPRAVAPFAWPATSRPDVQQKKFTVSPEEFASSLSRAFEMANHSAYVMEPLFDSVVRVSPQPS